MFSKRFFPIIFLLSGGFFSLSAQQGISLSVTPGLDVPTGGGDRTEGTYTLSGDEDIYSLGGGVSLHGNWGLASLPLFLSAGIDTDFIGTVNDRSMTFFGLTAGGGYEYSTYMYDVRGYMGMGAALGTYFTDSVMNFYMKGGGSFLFNLSSTLSIGPTAEFRYFHNNFNGLFLGLTAKLAPVPPISADQARYIGIQLAPVYPAFYRNYETYPAGLLSFVNGEQDAIEELEIIFYQKEIMDKPVVCGSYARVEPGKTVSVPIMVPLKEDILANAVETTLQGEITIRYRYNGRGRSLKTTKPLILAESHRIIDDLPEKKALFITPEEPTLSEYVSSVRNELSAVTATPVDRNFRTAMGIYTALSAEGISLKLTSDEQTGVERTFQYPVETLNLRSGEEKDLVIAYAALLESAGIESALLQLPGKTMAALALALPREEALTILEEGDYIDYRNKIWIPLDLAALDLAGFIDAWMSASAAWKGAFGEDRTFTSVHEAWEKYKPVKQYLYAEPGNSLSDSEANALAAGYEAELTAFIEKSIAKEEKVLLDRISRTGDVRTKNRLGVLYARYGLLDKAKTQFEPLSYDYAPAAVNMGNIFFLQEDYVKAYINYIAATEMDRENKYALLGKARTARELGEQETAETAYRALSAVDINLAIPFAYIADRNQTQIDIETRETVFWVEE